MIKRVFIDSDIILDVATGRMPFVQNSKIVLSIIENGKAFGMISSNSVTNIYYILRRLSSDEKARIFIKKILKYIDVISADHKNILDALDSKFNDFEDAVQNYSALSNLCDCIITRNTEDYKKSELTIYSPIEFISQFQL